MSRLRAAVTLAGFLGMTLPLMPVQALLLLVSTTGARRFPHLYHRALCKWLGIKVVVEGPLPDKPSLIVANHVSWLDIPVIGSSLPVSFVARHDMAQWPLFGQMAKLQRTLLVDRTRRQVTGNVKGEIAARLAAGDTIVLFPEGSSYDGINMLPFKSSYFAAARDTPVVPATLAYRKVQGLPLSRRERPRFAWYGDMELPAHLWHALKAGPIEVVLRFHTPLENADRKLLAAKAENTISASLSAILHGRDELG